MNTSNLEFLINMIAKKNIVNGIISTSKRVVRVSKISTDFNIKNKGVLLVAILIFIYCAPLFGLGKKEIEIEEPNSITNTQKLEQDPIFSEIINRNENRKPSLDYLRAVTQARNYLVEKDYYNAINRYTDLIVLYGEDVNLLYGLAETYFMLGDQNTSLSYYNQVIEKSQSARTKNSVASDFEVQALYRIAYLEYQKDSLIGYEQTLQKIIDSSDKFDEAIISVFQTEDLDYTLKLFITPLNYSYIARRELGVYYMYTKVGKENEITTVESDVFGVVEENLMANELANEYQMPTEEEYLYSAQLYLVSSLSMAVDSFREYLRITNIGYEFSDLAEMIEKMKMTEEGTLLLQSFDIERILIGLRKYYQLDSTSNPEKEFYAFQCTELLDALGYKNRQDSLHEYSYFPSIR